MEKSDLLSYGTQPLLDVYDNDEEKWKNAVKDEGGFTNYPLTLSIGMNSMDNDEIQLDLIAYTGGFSGDATIDLWEKNICSQFRNKPKNCS